MVMLGDRHKPSKSSLEEFKRMCLPSTPIFLLLNTHGVEIWYQTCYVQVLWSMPSTKYVQGDFLSHEETTWKRLLYIDICWKINTVFLNPSNIGRTSWPTAHASSFLIWSLTCFSYVNLCFLYTSESFMMPPGNGKFCCHSWPWRVGIQEQWYPRLPSSSIDSSGSIFQWQNKLCVLSAKSPSTLVAADVHNSFDYFFSLMVGLPPRAAREATLCPRTVHVYGRMEDDLPIYGQ